MSIQDAIDTAHLGSAKAKVIRPYMDRCEDQAEKKRIISIAEKTPCTRLKAVLEAYFRPEPVLTMETLDALVRLKNECDSISEIFDEIERDEHTCINGIVLSDGLAHLVNDLLDERLGNLFDELRHHGVQIDI